MPKQTLATRIALASVIALAGVSAHAALVSVTGAGAIISAPAQVIDTGVTNTQQEGFNEQQGVMLGAGGVQVDSGFVGANTLVNSHMIFLNIPQGTQSTSTTATWVFDGLILGVMSDVNGLLEDASNALLGATGTIYPGAFASRGFEGADSYTISGNTLTVNMSVVQPGDWIRVVTAVPEPGSLALVGLALAGLGLARRRKA